MHSFCLCFIYNPLPVSATAFVMDFPLFFSFRIRAFAVERLIPSISAICFAVIFGFSRIYSLIRLDCASFLAVYRKSSPSGTSHTNFFSKSSEIFSTCTVGNLFKAARYYAVSCSGSFQCMTSSFQCVSAVRLRSDHWLFLLDC